MIRRHLIYMIIALNMTGALQAMFNGTKLSLMKKLRTYCSKQIIIKLPSPAKLKENLCKKGFDHFVEHTEIDIKLGNKELYPLGVAVAVETHVYDYAESLKNPMIQSLMEMRKEQLIECILQDSPKGLEELRKQLKGTKKPAAPRE
jgi:hypothetical protein